MILKTTTMVEISNSDYRQVVRSLEYLSGLSPNDRRGRERVRIATLTLRKLKKMIIFVNTK